MPKVAGYLEMNEHFFIDTVNAYQYALDQVKSDKDLQQEFVEWFFSGNFISLLEEELPDLQKSD